MAVVLRAADLVGRLAAERDHVERVERDLRVRDGVRDRLLVAGGHVDRDRLDRGTLRVGQLVEEALQGRGVAARGGPHHAAALMVGDTCEEAAIGAIADLVHADHHQPVQPAAIELVGDHAGEDLADRPPADPHQFGQRRLGHLLSKERRHVLEVAHVRRAGPGPRHRLIHIPAARAVQASEPALDRAASGAEIEMPPTLLPVLLDRKALRTTARADRPLRAQTDRHDHALATERDVLNRSPRQLEHPVECRRDPHRRPPRRPLNFRHPAACRSGPVRVTALCANSGNDLSGLEPAPQQAIPPNRVTPFTPRWTGEPLCWRDVRGRCQSGRG